MMPDAETAYTEIYRLLDELRFADVLPVGALGRMFAAVDTMRAMSAPPRDVAIAEDISVAMLRWEGSRRRDAGLGEKVFRDRLAALTSDWMETRLPNPAMHRMPRTTGVAMTGGSAGAA